MLSQSKSEHYDNAKTTWYETFFQITSNNLSFVLPLRVDFDICLGESKTFFCITDSPSIDSEKHLCERWFGYRMKAFCVT